ncbi:MAG: hypothetical protein NNA23_01935 [Nitrospira sp.]|nr:hypothetical protein [Nitrospira sp.]MCP9464146.1 hypothetical protein [Nitrospira sp.]
MPVKAMKGRRTPGAGMVSLQRLRGGWIVCLGSILWVVSLLLETSVFAEVRTVRASGEYRWGETDTKEDAGRLALEAAKRNALEQVAIYVESVTVARGMDLTRDEIRTYTAGVVLVRDQRLSFSVEGDRLVARVDLVAQIETEDVIRAIAALRENEEARTQLAALKQETERLRQELERANRAQANGMADGGDSSMRRREILYRVQSNALVAQAWTDWALSHSNQSWDVSRERANLARLLEAARAMDPQSPHVPLAEKTMAGSERGPAPHASSPSVPSARESARLPRYELVPGPGASNKVHTLNELIYQVPQISR